ncbi:hypothetical protein Cst_c19970 [Thermoclostridium stercorarium subsp. stercorarium DSM 8532]|uniref:Uncharacterized protein n=1 Tax=Thermoclostridium stercorarium (strain ATCC 35414 / DSM 8532 / NCIMB 11754) TaxID=1121335 RepID=L7VLB6_THES1|nr:hypothetical protein Cst_c19970 [Thermoclostridium stercorarium subsp. stercorarium DSM 8532]
MNSVFCICLKITFAGDGKNMPNYSRIHNAGELKFRNN